jgi:hypothetical protein
MCARVTVINLHYCFWFSVSFRSALPWNLIYDICVIHGDEYSYFEILCYDTV